MLATPPDYKKLFYYYKIPTDKDGVWCANMDVFFPNIDSVVMFYNSSYNDELRFSPGTGYQASVNTSTSQYELYHLAGHN